MGIGFDYAYLAYCLEKWAQRNQFEQQLEIELLNTQVYNEVSTTLTLIQTSRHIGLSLGQLVYEDALARFNTGSVTYKQAWVDNVNTAILRDHRRCINDQSKAGMRYLLRV
jgi:hypothetical protein